MSIKSQDELDGLRAVGRVVQLALTEMKRHVRPGVTTAEINLVGERILAENDSRSAPAMVYGFPAATLISVNDEIVHGIPSDRIIHVGDLVKLDVTAEKDGYMADAAITVAVEPVASEMRQLVFCAQEALYRAFAAARAGKRIFAIGRAVEREVARSGFSVVRELCGHGIGRTIHEQPEIPNYFETRANGRLTRGLVITVEPMVTTGRGEAVQADDGWTIKTADGGFAAHFEHTIVVTDKKPLVLTAEARAS